MRLPIRNVSNRPLKILIEIECDEFEVPPGGEAIVRLEDGQPHSFEIDDGWVTIFNEGANASVEVVPREDHRVDDALMLATVWLGRFGAKKEAELLKQTIDDLEPVAGYLGARVQVFGDFYKGFSNEEQGRSASVDRQDGVLAACYNVGVKAAQLNHLARANHSFPELKATAPFDTETVRSAFARALADGT